MNAPASERARATRALVRVLIDGKTTDQTFGQLADADPGSTPGPLCQELVFGTLRYYFSLSDFVDAQLEKRLRSKDLDLRILMLVGAYQLYHMRIPDHAAINETVNACRPLRKPWARSLVNAVLRNLVRERDKYQAERSFELPEWMTQKLQNDFGDNADELMFALLERAPMSLRVNVCKISVASYQSMLDDAGIAHQAGVLTAQLVLREPISTASLPGYADGLVSVQDGGAMLASELMKQLLPGDTHPRILDACAAPGGKLFAICEAIRVSEGIHDGDGETLPGARLVALELSQTRYEHLKRETERLGHQQITLHHADATRLDWWDHREFDAILVDAPCSGVGTLRRHPDIKHLRRPDEISGYRHLQLNMLRNLWRTLAPGGTLLYCTCSLFQEENDNVVNEFLSAADDADSLPLPPVAAATGQATRYGWQIMPQTFTPERDDPKPNVSMDGFYYAALRKHAHTGNSR
jgi:16S rRNA (cytosine967-C5)-methyltransferase